MSFAQPVESKIGWIRKDTVCILLAAILLGLSIRLIGLEQIGFAEDEVNKILAVRQYQQGDFTVNAEHPMLMKLLILGTVGLADRWNRWMASVPGGHLVAEEVAVRFPNILVGALTAIPLFLVGSFLFSQRVGILAAFLWAVGLQAVFINRIAKEDTLLVFFLLWGIYFHGRMKTTPDADGRRKRTFHLLSAVCFGLMLASKYFPHFWGLTLLFYYLHRKLNPGLYPADRYGRRDLALYVAVMAAVFLLANPMLVHTKVLGHIFSYTGQSTVTHHGYMMFGHLFPNSILLTPFGGTPWYFYLLALIVKLPPLVLLVFMGGVGLSLRRWRDPGPYFLLFWLLFWLVPYSIVGVKFLRYSLTLMPAVYLAAAWATCEIADWLVNWRCWTLPRPLLRWITHTVLGGLMVLVSLAALIASQPYFSLYVNRWGGGQGRSAYYFPHDECYDLLLREAIVATLRQAPTGSVVAGETPAVFRYYLAKLNRPDIRVINLSDARLSQPISAPVFVFLQPGRIYFENRTFYTRLWNRSPEQMSARIEGRPLVRVFRLNETEFMELLAMRQRIPPRFQTPLNLNYLISDKEPA